MIPTVDDIKRSLREFLLSVRELSQNTRHIWVQGPYRVEYEIAPRKPGVAELVEDIPGIYLFYSSDHKLLYVGKAQHSLRQRLRQHFRYLGPIEMTKGPNGSPERICMLTPSDEAVDTSYIFTICFSEEFAYLIPALELFLISYCRPSKNIIDPVNPRGRQFHRGYQKLPSFLWWGKDKVGQRVYVKKGFFALIPPGVGGVILDSDKSSVRVQLEVSVQEWFDKGEFMDTFEEEEVR